jgi:hypothetical protein
MSDQSVIGINIAPEYTSNIGRAEDIITRLNPTMLMVLEGTGDPERKVQRWALERKQRHPNAVIGYREVRKPKEQGGDDPWGGDGNYWRTRPVEEYVERIKRRGHPDLHWVTQNEPDTNDMAALIDWEVRLMDACYQIGQPLLVGHLAAGNPEDPPKDALGKFVRPLSIDEGVFDPLIRALDKYRGFHYLADHGGAFGDLTFGVGTYPPEQFMNPAFMRTVHSSVPIRYERFKHVYGDGSSAMLYPTNYMLDRHLSRLNIRAREMPNPINRWIPAGYSEIGVDMAGVSDAIRQQLSRDSGAGIDLVATMTMPKVYEWWRPGTHWEHWLYEMYRWFAQRTYAFGACLFTWQDTNPEWTARGHDLSQLTVFWDRLINEKLTPRTPPGEAAPMPEPQEPPIVVQPPTTPTEPTPPPTPPQPPAGWRDGLDERQRAEIKLAEWYKLNPHGTDGHNRLLLIAKMAELLDAKERAT